MNFGTHVFRSAPFNLRTLTLLATLTAPGAALAAPAAYLDLFYVPQAKLKAEAPAANDQTAVLRADDDGFGIKGAMTLTPRLFLSGEYTSNQYDVTNAAVSTRIDVDGWRAGMGLILFDAGPTTYVLAEYIDTDAEARVPGFEAVGGDESGYGLHLGMRGENGKLAVTVQVGYVDLGDSDGLEWLVESDYRITNRFGLFAGYRSTHLDGGNTESDFRDIRVGATLYLGG